MRLMCPTAVNQKLANSCQNCGAACCRKGKIFLPKNEHAAMRDHAEKLGGNWLKEFDARVSDHGLFFLYDQLSGCQFLDAQNLCRLHDLGLKPSECFWWPYHVFSAENESLEVRLFTECCDAHTTHDATSPYPADIAAKAAEIGVDVIQSFRQIYGGSQAARSVGQFVIPANNTANGAPTTASRETSPP
jgi:Fe-S-cluster containining protein